MINHRISILVGVAALAAGPFSLAAGGAAGQDFMGFGFGIGPNMYFGGSESRSADECRSDDIAERLESSGYADIRLGRVNGQELEVWANRAGKPYRLLVDKCSGQILSRQRARARAR